MGACILFTLTPSVQIETAVKHLTSAIMELQPTGIRPWERCLRYDLFHSDALPPDLAEYVYVPCRTWNQTKHGQGEDAMVKLVSGVLTPIATFHTPHTCVLVHDGKAGQKKVLECGVCTDALLKSLQYSQSKEVFLTLHLIRISYLCRRRFSSHR